MITNHIHLQFLCCFPPHSNIHSLCVFSNSHLHACLPSLVITNLSPPTGLTLGYTVSTSCVFFHHFSVLYFHIHQLNFSVTCQLSAHFDIITHYHTTQYFEVPHWTLSCTTSNGALLTFSMSSLLLLFTLHSIFFFVKHMFVV